MPGQKAKRQAKERKEDKRKVLSRWMKEVPPTEVDGGERFRNKTCFALSFPTGPERIVAMFFLLMIHWQANMWKRSMMTSSSGMRGMERWVSPEEGGNSGF